mgnify:CR=1 FL=1|jgi:RHH-type proline utilization regulon transcriptional repressor/proline dehydrogenase/delta 1-pyrroline-5-carboxylate dehydrogenase|tara:strand:+ start:236 stop:3382 length:3147 start_codon:yes stop_codon:yes gene_type:complete
MNDRRGTTELAAELDQLREDIYRSYQVPEEQTLAGFIDAIKPSEADDRQIRATGTDLIQQIRSHPDFNSGFEAFMAEYRLDTFEGVRLMTLTEALARIPDEETKEALIRSKLSGVDWGNHIGHSLSPLVNSSTRALLFTTSMLDAKSTTEVPWLAQLIERIGEPAIRIALDIGTNLFSQHFVLGEDLQQAGRRAEKEKHNYSYSYDMLGEAALTMDDADRFHQAYQEAIRHVGQADKGAISIKLSALHPRFDVLQRDRVMNELLPRLCELLAMARQNDVSVTIDAEEIDRLEISLIVIEQLIKDGVCSGWHDFGIAVQSYSCRAMPVLQYLKTLAEFHGERLGIRLVKGAYWDAEIKHAQNLGLPAYPVYTRKPYTDIAFLACARFLLDSQDLFYPQFATHNVHTVANILHWVQRDPNPVAFEFQRLHGMGQLLYDCILQKFPDINCCIYAPIGQQKELLPYLIRRLLENAANASFVNQLAANTPAEQLVTHPTELLHEDDEGIPLPGNLYLSDRINSAGINLRSTRQRDELLAEMQDQWQRQWQAAPYIRSTPFAELRSGLDSSSLKRAIHAPQDDRRQIGTVLDTPADMLADAIADANQAYYDWRRQPTESRCAVIGRLADLLEANRAELIALTCLEAGKTLPDCISEIREAVDFCRYYAARAQQLDEVELLPGPTGEKNELYYRSRGVFLCISPWNFPVAIYLGQITAALVTANTVIAKPAEQTTLVAYRILQLMHEAGIPKNVVQFVPGDGEKVGPSLLSHQLLSGVVFTGSYHTAKIINRQLAARDGALIPLIAETGGQNVLIADSSALPEQLVKDALHSAFNSAGQRCSALRVLYLQDSSADAVIELLAGSINELSVGDPQMLATDIGPVIDSDAEATLRSHIDDLDRSGRLLARADSHGSADLSHGNFVAPCAYEIDSISELKDEHFGPILHVIRYKPEEISRIIKEINQTEFALTLGVHSRNEQFAELIEQQVNAGNIYVNRNMIGAVVGTHPFGGFGLSGTGPKAGGPHYLQRFMVEISRSVNTAAVGGDYQLLSRKGS